MARTRHSASVAQLRAAAERLADANTDIAAATATLSEFSPSSRWPHSGGGRHRVGATRHRPGRLRSGAVDFRARGVAR